MNSLYEGILGRLNRIGDLMGLSSQEIELLSGCKQITHVEFDVDGEKFEGWRVIHNNSLGPGKGGIRFHPNVSEDEVKSLSLWMSLKNSLAGLPYGGGKGGIKFDPKEKDSKQLEKISRAFMQKIHGVVGQDQDIPAPDVYTNSQIMAWLLDEYEKINGKHEPGMITGKPLELGGIALRNDATSKGGYIVINDLVEKIGKDKKELTVAVQGFGNAGSYIAKMLENDGVKIVAASDSRGGIHDESGLDIQKIMDIKKERKGVAEYGKGTVIDNQQILELDVDILILAALENQITEENAENIKANYIVELANGPITPEADAILFKKDIMILPDILANSGGVTVSYFEWCQNRAGGVLDEDYLAKKLESMMLVSWNKVYSLYIEKEKEIDLRSCAYMIAIERILVAERYRGNV